MVLMISSSGILLSRVFISVMALVSCCFSRFLISCSRASLVILLTGILYFFIFFFRVLSTRIVTTSVIQIM